MSVIADMYEAAAERAERLVQLSDVLLRADAAGEDPPQAAVAEYVELYELEYHDELEGHPRSADHQQLLAELKASLR